jgi:hypothetical protein
MSLYAKYIVSLTALLSVVASGLFGQAPQVKPANFKDVVEKRLKKIYGKKLSSVCPIDSDPTARRIFSEYGAIFISNNGGNLPARCIFDSEAEVQAFQTQMKPDIQNIGGAQITLQKAAMTELLDARAEAGKKGLNISPRGGSEAAMRSYRDTVRLWNSRFLPALDHWVGNGKILAKDAEAIKKASVPKQVAKVLEWEQHGLYFSKDLSKSILYSVAAPGASQHIFMLAFDVEQFSNKEVRKILAEHGWFQTVKSDLPHFTYLGVPESELPSLGLKHVQVDGQTFWIPNIE